ncbi:UNVERIFIED_CONTAM: Aspartic proteinase CDR1 [Sesamum latifolium]|uniref:Aspartic proteinase CDR1 n=1 Tax=Sesamum latifolium TaxID=2727402 RepID=A0AAW2U134_9LAMI
MPLMASSADFRMKLSIGTPPFEIMGILDTGSVLSWMQCALRVIIVTLKTGLFHSQGIINLQSAAGKFKTLQTPWREVFYFRGQHMQVFFAVSGQILFSWSHLFGHSHHKFYIRSSKIHFGSNSVVSGANVVFTGLQFFRNSFALRLKGISVGKKKLAMTRLSNSTSSSKVLGFFNERIIIDSGTVLTHLPKKLYQSLEEAMKKEIKLEQAHAREMLRLCYKTPDGKIRGPIVTVHFVGADVKLYPTNTFLRVSEGVHCLVFVPHDGVAIFGNLAQRNFLVGFDLRRKTLSFKQTDCSKQ